MDDINFPENDFEKAQILQNILIARATGSENGNADYKILRQYFYSNGRTKDLLPSFVRTCRELEHFWQFIKGQFAHYAERREFIYKQFSPLLDYLESSSKIPADEDISNELKSFDENGIHAVWTRALERRNTDPEGAITISRTLLESVCKYILDDLQITYDADKIELPELYRLTSKELNLSASQHSAEIFRQILGGCAGIVSGLGQLRNKMSDAHGKGKKVIRPAPRHAELAVNLAGAVALFLIKTYQSKKSK